MPTRPRPPSRGRVTLTREFRIVGHEIRPAVLSDVGVLTVERRYAPPPARPARPGWTEDGYRGPPCNEPGRAYNEPYANDPYARRPTPPDSYR
jgi:hypothetical protein